MAYEIIERTASDGGITIWRDTESGRYAATKDTSDGMACEPTQAIFETPELAVECLLEIEQASRED